MDQLHPSRRTQGTLNTSLPYELIVRSSTARVGTRRR
jgi:hypothetical protein